MKGYPTKVDRIMTSTRIHLQLSRIPEKWRSYITTIPQRLTHTRTQPTSVEHVDVFDNHLKKLQRDGAARSYKLWNSSSSNSIDYDYFRREIAHRLVDRLDDIQREHGFPVALDIGTMIHTFSYYLE
jgi:hypothetical protein